MRQLYPEIEPHSTGMLPVGDGNEIYWEECGNPDGKPVVFLHGGPGTGAGPNHRRLFDPARYRIVLLDQRGAGRSTPHAAHLTADLSTNTTQHLVADLEKLRVDRGIDRWQVFGGSWGSTLALAYAEAHPDRVTELVLRGIFTCRREELAWSYAGGLAHLFPDEWENLIALVPEAERGAVLESYHRMLTDPDPSVREPAAIAWARMEAATSHLHIDDEHIADFTEPTRAAALARIEVHYFRNGVFVEEGQLLRDAGKLRDIPGVIVQGRYDVVTPPATAWALHRAWPEAEFVMVPDAGHAFDEPGTLDALITATDRFADR